MPKHKTSAGILIYRFREGALEVFIGHQGGPLEESRDLHVWTVPKGQVGILIELQKMLDRG